MSMPFQESYATLTEEQLIDQAKSGDQSAAACVIWRYTPLVRKRASVYYSMQKGLEYDDLVQEGMIGLLAAVRVYDSKAAAFSTFARLCIDRILIELLRKQGRKKRVPYETLSTLDTTEEANVNQAVQNNPEQIVIAKEEFEWFKNKLTQRLSRMEYQVLTAFFQSDAYEDIARQLGITPKAVDNALQRIRKKLK